MKTSNKILFGGLGFLFLAGVLFAGITRSNANVWSEKSCEQLPRNTKNLTLEFDKVEISQNIHATLRQGDFSVQLDATNEVMSNLKHEVEAGVFKLYIEKGSHAPCPVKVVLTCPQLNKIQTLNGSSLSSEGTFKTSSLEANAMNGSNITLDIESDIVKVTAQNSANISISGTINQLDATAQNSAQIFASKAKAMTAILKLANSSLVTVKADTISRASISNSSTLEYMGEAQLGDISSNNSSSIRKILEE